MEYLNICVDMEGTCVTFSVNLKFAHKTSRLRARHHVSKCNQCLSYLSCAIKHTKTDTQNYGFDRISESRADTLLADLGNHLHICIFKNTDKPSNCSSTQTIYMFYMVSLFTFKMRINLHGKKGQIYANKTSCEHQPKL
jgi:hypothetical protein